MPAAEKSLLDQGFSANLVSVDPEGILPKPHHWLAAGAAHRRAILDGAEAPFIAARLAKVRRCRPADERLRPR
jgi:hypothetical protein